MTKAIPGRLDAAALAALAALSVEDRREAVRELAANGKNNCEIAGVVGVTEGTVRNDLNSQNYESAEIEAISDQSVAETASENSAPSPIAAARKAGEEARKAVDPRLRHRPDDPAVLRREAIKLLQLELSIEDVAMALGVPASALCQLLSDEPQPNQENDQ